MTDISPLGLRIDSAELRLVRLPLLTPFVISTGTMTEKVFPLLTLRGEGLEGYAEGVMDVLPDYLEETQSAALDFLRQAVLPGLIGRRFSNPAEIAAELAPWRGHRMAKAMVEMAFWDLWAKALDQPLSALLGGVRDAVEVGVSLGIADIPTTLERVETAVASGYRRVKLKIKRGHDLKLLEAVRTRFPDIKLTVDANTDYRLPDLPLLVQMDRFGLDYIEQPLAFDDIHDHAKVQARLVTAICLDESIRSATDARKALVAEAARVINIKVGRVGGFAEARAIHDLCAAFDVPVWCGGMLESGIGRAQNIHLASLPNFSKPGDTSSASRYFAKDITEQQLESDNGLMAVPRHGPGLGVTLDRSFLDQVTGAREDFR
ncbi:o-succinylbenzoate synthase [Paracoccus sp. PAR01]|uniref:o-succinylbenzoate synthase n=1 Tax=Paracoccus sp. PAR01 TaxID=2769282 RepID=UPI00177AFBD4|nr:o-succinylbenzoate synthase [Paracoccus sp. PAR01]MBD9527414.1 o-succinylbenzoate synthase [Paracoccus sp. PAR01]